MKGVNQQFSSIEGFPWLLQKPSPVAWYNAFMMNFSTLVLWQLSHINNKVRKDLWPRFSASLISVTLHFLATDGVPTLYLPGYMWINLRYLICALLRLLTDYAVNCLELECRWFKSTFPQTHLVCSFADYLNETTVLVLTFQIQISLFNIGHQCGDLWYYACRWLSNLGIWLVSCRNLCWNKMEEWFISHYLLLC